MDTHTEDYWRYCINQLENTEVPAEYHTLLVKAMSDFLHGLPFLVKWYLILNIKMKKHFTNFTWYRE
jgi:hypothetical protein